MTVRVGEYRVRYRDVYSAGVVLNSRYLDICDIAFTEFFRAVGLAPADLAALPFDGALAHMDATFLASAKVDDVLTLDVTCDHVGRTSVVLTFTMACAGADVFRGTARYVNIDGQARPTPVPEVVRAALITG